MLYVRWVLYYLFRLHLLEVRLALRVKDGRDFVKEGKLFYGIVLLFPRLTSDSYCLPRDAFPR